MDRRLFGLIELTAIFPAGPTGFELAVCADQPLPLAVVTSPTTQPESFQVVFTHKVCAVLPNTTRSP
jgi:hypothetical protein